MSSLKISACEVLATLSLLLDETHVCPAALCGFHFQSVGFTLISPNKRCSVIVSVEKTVLLALLISALHVELGFTNILMLSF